MQPAFALVALLVASAVAGCAGSSGTATTSPERTVLVDSPFNRTADGDSAAHLHDYWGGAHRLTIADVDIDAPGYLWFGADSISVASLRPEAGHVVPQGAGWVNVTVAWADDSQAVPPTTYSNVQLYVKSASDNALVLRANLSASPSTVAIPIGPDGADLPHQVLSAWQFDLFMAPNPEAVPNPVVESHAAFTGTVHFTVTADRTLPIELFPGHADRWGALTEIKLFAASGALFYDGDPTVKEWRCYGDCPVIFHPDDGVVVPFDAATVVIKLGVSGTSPTKLGLKVHAADSREFVKATLMEDTPTLRTYSVPVLAGGDGPYAKQSQWEIVPYPEFPVENGYVFESAYTIEATAYRHL